MEKKNKHPDNLESFVLKNKDSFDVHEPGFQTWNKISRAIPSSKKKGTVVQMVARFTAVAALVVIAVTFFLWVLKTDHSTKNLESNYKKEYRLQDVSPDMAEVEFYYASKINNALKELDKIEPGSELLEEIRTLETEYLALQKEMGENYDNELIVEAMIANYRLRLSLLESVLVKLKNLNSDEIENDILTVEI